MAYTKTLLSGSTDGKQIKVTGTNAAGAVTVHTAVSGTSSLDEVYLYAYNDDTATRLVTILWGGTTEPDNAIRAYLGAKSGRTLVVDGALLQNSLVVKAFADAANVVLIDGFVNRIS